MPYETTPVYAFPATIDVANGRNGMTLRDWFAAQWLGTYAIGPNAPLTPQQIAATCYAIADAMLAAREEVK